MNPVHTIRGVLLASIGIIVLAFGAGAAFYLFRDTQIKPATNLPALETVALFSHVTSKELAPYDAVFPVLSGVPTLSSPAHVAILQLAGNRMAWIVFPQKDEVPLQASANITHERVGTLGILTSGEPDIMELLRPTVNRLQDDYDFRALSGVMGNMKPWVLLRPSLMTSTQLTTTDADLLTLLPKESLVAVSLGTSSLFFSKSRLADAPSIVLSQPSFLEQPDKVMTFSRGDDWWKLVTETSLSRQAKIQTWARQTFGTDVSFTYDVLPLLHGASHMEMRTIADQHSFVFTGKADTERLAQSIYRLHASMLRKHASIKVVNQTLDAKQGFTLQAVMEDTEQTTSTKEQDDWQIQTSGSGSGMLVTALKDKSFIIASHPQLVQKVIRDQPSKRVTLPIPASWPVTSLKAGGHLTEQHVRTLWPLEQSGLLPLFFPNLLQNTTVSVQWSLAENASVGSLSLVPVQ